MLRRNQFLVRAAATLDVMPADRNEPSAEREERSRVIPLPGQAMGRDVTQRQPGDGARIGEAAVGAWLPDEVRRTALLGANVWRQMLGVDKATVIESVGIDEEANAVVARAPAQGDQASLRTVRGPRAGL